jgi:hypothetical protein
VVIDRAYSTSLQEIPDDGGDIAMLAIDPDSSAAAYPIL